MAGRCRPHRSDEDLHDGDHGDHRGVPPARRELVEHVSGDRMGRIGRIRGRPRSSRTRRSGCRRSCAGEDAVGRRPAPRRPTEMPYGEGCPPFRSFGGLTPEGHGGYIAEMSTGIRLPPVSRRLGGAPSADQCPDCPPTRGGQSDSGWRPLPAVDGAANRRGPIGRAHGRSMPRPHQGPDPPAEVALSARGKELALARGPAGDNRHDVVDVEHDPPQRAPRDDGDGGRDGRSARSRRARAGRVRDAATAASTDVTVAGAGPMGAGSSHVVEPTVQNAAVASESWTMIRVMGGPFRSTGTTDPNPGPQRSTRCA